MIRYDVSQADVRAAVKKEKRGWLARAEERTEKFKTAGKFEESSSIWSEIKPAFMKLQFDKCAFCEQKVEGGPYGRINHDLEHFRPKNKLKAWPTADSAYQPGFSTGSIDHSGYYWLAYDLTNYATACKVCNSTLKSNRFPIAGPRGNSPSRGRALHREEKPFLCYPIGRIDEDPEALIGFEGTVAVPIGTTERSRRRGEVMIEFFKLNRRDSLHYQRASQILHYHAIVISEDDPDQRHEYRQILLEDSNAHVSCTRSFAAAWDTDPHHAKQILSLAKRIHLRLTNVVHETEDD